MSTRVVRWFAPLLGLSVLVAGWQLAVRVLDTPAYVVPAPSEVARALWDTRSLLLDHLWATVSVALAGLAVGALAGVVIAALLTAVPALRRALQPLLVASQSVPVVVLAPMFIVWFGFGTLPRVLVVALAVFFPVAVATLDGLAGADLELVDLVRGMGARRRDVLIRVRIPHAFGSFLSGLRIAAAYAMFGAIVAEWVGAEEGLGIYVDRSRDSYRTDRVFAAIVLIAAVSVTLFMLVTALERLLTPWRATERTGRQELPL